MSDEPIRIILAHEPPPPASKWEKAFAFLMFLGVIWPVLVPRKRRG